jgi:hypothetical protein
MPTELRVSLGRQTVEVLKDGTLAWQAPISTSSKGAGEESGSYRTPRGCHHISEKIGDDAPWGTIFKSREPIGVWKQGEVVDADLVLTRILWLAGDEPANATSKERYIYFHGTNHEDKIGTPASHGCIRLRNDDMIVLYDLAQVGDPVLITED